MDLKQVYNILLRLYPKDHRELFATEMAAAFEKAVEERGGLGFAFRELAGLVGGAAAAWVAKFTSKTYLNGVYLPRNMRPPNKTREQWWPAGARVPDDVAEALRRLEVNHSGMVYAIAIHDFKRARAFSNEDLKAREDLHVLREKYNPGE
jgi:hypothetical protein